MSEVFRVTRVRKNPQSYQAGKSTRTITKRAMLALLAADNRREVVKIERAEVSEFVDVTAEWIEKEGE